MNQSSSNQLSDTERIVLRKRVTRSFIRGIGIPKLAAEIGQSDAFIYTLLSEAGIDIQPPRYPSEHLTTKDAMSPITVEHRTSGISIIITNTNAAGGLAHNAETGKPYEWRLSGSDFRLHAFLAADGYVEPHELCAFVAESGSDFETFGPYEVWVAECGHAVPKAMLLPAVASHSGCPGCKIRVGIHKTRPPLNRYGESR